VSSGGLLASAPDPLPPVNRCMTPLRVLTPEPLSPVDEVSTLASEACAGRPDALGVRSPLKTVSRVESRA